MKPVFRAFCFVILAAFGAANSLAFEDSSRVLSLSHESESLGREMPMKVFLPKGYQSSKDSYPVLFLLHGLGGSSRNWSERTDLLLKSESLRLIIVMPEGGDGWYSDSVSDPKEAYESYLIKDLLPFVDASFQTIAKREARFIAGLSMGGFGAIKFGLNHPNLFSVVGSFSGALDAPLRGEGNAFLRPSISRVFGEPDSELRRNSDIFRTVESASEESRGDFPFIYLDCGTEDWLMETNRKFSELLLSKKIPHEFRQLPGRHDWQYWNSQVGQFLRLLVGRGAVVEDGFEVNVVRGD
jgi:putative tributyrin esterase